MKNKTLRTLLFLYQGVFGSRFASCRYSPTCSLYMVSSVEKYGLIKGTAKGIGRILSCHPLSKRPYFDPA